MSIELRIAKAIEKCRKAWLKAGGKAPCYEPKYMAARAELEALVKERDALDARAA